MKKKPKASRAARENDLRAAERNCKIASLPGSLREEVCRRLHDGHSGPMILQWLDSLPEVRSVLEARYRGVPVSLNNLSRWRRHGYQAWLKQQDLPARAGQLAEAAARIARASGTSLVGGAVLLITGKILERLDQPDEDAKPAADPADPVAEGADAPAAPAMDTKSLVEIARVVSTLRQAEQNDERIAADRQRIALAREQFEYNTAGRILSLLHDVRLRELGNADIDNIEKIEAIGRHMFGPDWRRGEPARKLPPTLPAPPV